MVNCGKLINILTEKKKGEQKVYHSYGHSWYINYYINGKINGKHSYINYYNHYYCINGKKK